MEEEMSSQNLMLSLFIVVVTTEELAPSHFDILIPSNLN